MSKMNIDINLSGHDDLFQKLVELHDGRTEAESRKINAKLIIAMMNQIGDRDVVLDVIGRVAASTEKWSDTGTREGSDDQ